MIWIGLDPGDHRYATLCCPFCGLETEACDFGLKRQCQQCRRVWHTVSLVGLTMGEWHHQEHLEGTARAEAG